MALLVFAFMFGVSTQSEYCMGDSFLRALGLKAWSMESAEHSTNGFHYTLLYSLAFAILGYVGAKHYLQDIFPKLVNKLQLIVIILIFTSTQLFTWGYGVVLSFSEGVNAVDYITAQSNCIYTSDSPDDLLSYQYQIILKNYSNQTVKFNMQVQKPSTDAVTMWNVTAANLQGQETLKEFTLYPREQKQFRFVMDNRDDEHSFTSGSMSRPNITIFNQESSRQFKVH